MVSAERLHIVSQRRSTTLLKEGNIWFRNPRSRTSFQICSIGFISGVYGGMKNNRILDGTISFADLCHAAPSQHKSIVSSGYASASVRKKTFIHPLSQLGIIRKCPSPVKGSIAPYTYRYSRMWWQGTFGRCPLIHQQYLGLLIRPNPASS